ncbi:MAG: hypothetical protein KDK99_00980 [Verrucomicrobiales bacterium]|nr:hypothetical protein [Verrucomicrobiales bacterium]
MMKQYPTLMRAIGTVVIALTTMTHAAAPVAELTLSPPRMTAGTTLELVFAMPMVAQSAVGQRETESPLVISPTVAGWFEWTSTRSGIYHLEAAPRFDAEYRFRLRDGLKDRSGSEVKAISLGEAAAEGFTLVDQDPKWFERSNLKRDQGVLLQFNAAVNAEKAATQVVFRTKDGSTAVPAHTRWATGTDLRRYWADPQRTWDEEVAGVELEQVADAAVRENALLVTPAEPLPVGEDWQVVISKSIGTPDGRHALGETREVALGTVQPFKMTAAEAHTPFDRAYYLEIDFNKTLLPNPPQDKTADDKATEEQRRLWRQEQLERIASHITVEPAVELKVNAKASGSRDIVLEGAFQPNQSYTVKLRAGLRSADDLPLDHDYSETVSFVPNAPYLAVPAFSRSQRNAAEGAALEFTAANVDEVRVRVKRLNGAEWIEALELYRPYERAFRASEEKRRAYVPPAFDEYPGAQVLDRRYPVSKALDQSEALQLDWREVLGQSTAGAFLVELEGHAMPGVTDQAVRTQCLMELTDIGLMFKTNARDGLVFATHYGTGQPLADLRVTLLDAERKLIDQGRTDANGIAHLRARSAAYVLAESDSDLAVLKMDHGQSEMYGIYGWEIDQTWRDVWVPQRRTLVFSDRPLYRPGETLHVQAMTRLLTGDTLSLDAQPATARFKLRDARQRLLRDEPITFSASGSWSGSVTLPEEPLGSYEVEIEFPQGADGERPNGGYLHVRVDDYRPASFEITLDGRQAHPEEQGLVVPLSASYFMGKPLSEATLDWSAVSEPGFEPDTAFSKYQFGDAPRWSGYYIEDESGQPEEGEEDEWFVSGDTELNADGTAELTLPAPPPQAAGLPREVAVSVDVTDLNEQTLSAHTRFTVPGAKVLPGAKGTGFFGRTGEEMKLEIIAVDGAGAALRRAVEAQCLIERREVHTVRVETAGGGTTTEDQARRIEMLRQTVTLQPPAEAGTTALQLPYTPPQGGAYFLTVTTTDEDGRQAFCRLPFYVIAPGEYPWAVDEGSRIELQAEKSTLHPGEEAVIVVKSPIEGTALVTVERNGVTQHRVQPFHLEDPVVRLPIGEADAPNVYVSVLIVRGAEASPKKYALPEYRAGYCELRVDSDALRLQVEVTPSAPEVRPREEVQVTATITAADGRPLPGAEVTLMAVDEGVLSLMPRPDPDPASWFHQPFPLAIENHTSFDDLLSADPSLRERGNKGFLVGGGGMEGADAALPIRQHFLTTPLWSASVTADENGQARSHFTAPDSLTRYRLLAVVSSGVDRFGTGRGAVTVNQPLMIEPVLPRFARVGDEARVKALIHNTTTTGGEVEVTATLTGPVEILREARDFAPGFTASSEQSHTWKIAVPAAGTTRVMLPVHFKASGVTSWTWSARSLSGFGDAPQQDAVQRSLPVEMPVPALREVRYARVSGKDWEEIAPAQPAAEKTPSKTPSKGAKKATAKSAPPAKAPASVAERKRPNLLADVRPVLLEGTGWVEVSLGRSRLIEVRDALDYVLTYPYGCAEQTSSAMMPWLALGGFEPLFPGQLDPERSRDTVQKGVDRLLRMVTGGGGLAYWPGGSEPSLWASAYGGQVLLRAQKAGAQMPQGVIDDLLTYLSRQLRDLETEADPHRLTDCALALYTLARGGRAEPAYHTLLHSRRNQLPEAARLYTALAMLVAEAPEAPVKDLLGWTADQEKADWTPPEAAAGSRFSHWAGNNVNDALRLIACAHLGLKVSADRLTTRILSHRNGRGEWGNTYVNAWTLLALAAHERSLPPPPPHPVAATLAWGSQKKTLHLPPDGRPVTTRLPLAADRAAAPLTVDLPGDATCQARLEVHAFPTARDFQPEHHGLGIQRQYLLLQPDGTAILPDQWRIGDLVEISLGITLEKETLYLAIEDPLPAALEPLNLELETQRPAAATDLDDYEPWFCDHRELRQDRALFFTDFAPAKGHYVLRYLARVIAEGDHIAPPARIEAMYEPTTHGLSASTRFLSLPVRASPTASKD